MSFELAVRLTAQHAARGHSDARGLASLSRVVVMQSSCRDASGDPERYARNLVSRMHRCSAQVAPFRATGGQALDDKVCSVCDSTHQVTMVAG